MTDSKCPRVLLSIDCASHLVQSAVPGRACGMIAACNLSTRRTLIAKAKRPRLPTLAQLTGERPRCQYCGKSVQPRTHRVLVLGHLTQVPTIEELRTTAAA